MLKTRYQVCAIGVVLALAAGCATDRSTGPAVGDSPLAGVPEQPAPVPADTAGPATHRSSAIIWSRDRGIRELPAPAGFDLVATDINDSGEVTGMVVDNSGRSVEAFIWSEAGGLRRLGSLSGFGVGGLIVTGINGAGTVVGYQHAFAGGKIRAFFASAESGLSALSDQDTWAGGINDAGTIVGWSRTAPFLFKPGEGLQSLAVTAAECTVATEINDADEVLGWSGDELSGMGCWPQAWIVWRGKEAPVEIANCPLGCSLDLVAFNDNGVAAGHDSVGAVRMSTRGAGHTERMAGMATSDINDPGDVTGNIRVSGQPVVWTAAGELVHLPLPAGKSKGTARAINNRGEVVGAAW